MSEHSDQSHRTSLKTRSHAASSHTSLCSSVSEARRRVELSKLKARQAQRTAAAKAETARHRAQLAEAEAQADAQAALDKAEQDALELALLEEDARYIDGHRSASRSRNRDTPGPEMQRHPSPAAAPTLLSPTPQRLSPGAVQQETMQRTSQWIAQLPRTDEAAERPLPQPNTLRPSPALPTLKLDTYDGSPLEWPRWSALFKALVHDNAGLTNTERLVHLQSCLKGEAREAVRGLLCNGSLYGEALRELERQFGNPRHVVRANLRTVFDMEPVRSEDDLAALSALSAALHCAVKVLQMMEYEADLAATQNMQQIIQKLPRAVAWKWGEYCVQTNLSSPTLTSIDHWLRGVVDAGRAVCDLSEAPQTNTQRRHDRQSGERQRSSRAQPDTATRQWRSSLAVTSPVPSPAQTDAPDGVATCRHCQGSHVVPHCPEFAALPLSERAAAVRQHGLCWSCLRSGHVARKCPSKQKCTAASDCAGWHHPLLHGAPRAFPLAPPVTAASTQARTEQFLAGVTAEEPRTKIILQILPLRVNGPRGQRTVNVMFDLGSQVTLITEQLANDLGLQGPSENLTLGTVDGSRSFSSQRVEFTLQAKGSSQQFHVTDARTSPVLNVSGPAVKWPTIKQKWPHLCDLDLAESDSRPAAILLGSDAFDLIVPRAVREGPPGAPWAVLTRLGWVATGKLPMEYADSRDDRKVYHVKLAEKQDLHEEVTKWWKTEEFGTKYRDVPNHSKQDEAAIDILSSTTKWAGDRYETGLLWKSPDVRLTGNVSSALSRLHSTERKLDRDPKLAEAYCATMDDYISKGYAKRLTSEELESEHARQWYLPHHAVHSVNKPDKIRVVFDAAARQGGTSLNQQLLAGPDLTNSLIGVLLRFRQRPVALAADINAMFHQVRVRQADQPALRFLWRGMDRQRSPDHYQMQVLIFGATSSPCSATHVLRKCANDFQNEHPLAAEAVRTRFYVDDYLDSVEDDNQAVELQQSLSSLLAKGGFTLSKWASSSPAVMNCIDDSDRSVTSREISKDDQKCERALGVYWDTETDMITFRTTPMDRPATKRGILSRVSSIFDPLGLLAPWVLTAKCLLQSIWRTGYDWDEPITNETIKNAWREWTTELLDISEFRVQRCYRTQRRVPVNSQLHLFGDASEMAFGVVAYLRQEYEDGQVSCALILAKNRVAPLRQLSIPRLELQAAVMAVRAAVAIKQELDIEIHATYFWSDSRTVLQWINNESRRYQNFVANRVAEIQDESDRRSWRHVPGKLNPADICSRGCSLRELLKSSWWLNGPDFLRRPEAEWPAEPAMNEIENAADLEKRRIARTCLSLEDKTPIIEPGKFSDWRKLLRVTAWVRRFSFNSQKSQAERRSGPLLPNELCEAETYWCQSVQREVFAEELAALKRGQNIPSTSKLLPLSPFVDSCGLIRVGGRLQHASGLSYEAQHQVILPAKHEVTRLIITDRHKRLAHAGSEHVLSDIRQNFWILRGRAAVKTYTFKCPVCVRARATPRPPLMADLPAVRVGSGSPPFSAVGVDFFGPILVRQNGTHKRYGCIFTCLSTRAIHLEVSHSLDTDSLIMCLRRMIARRGHPRVIYSDNGTSMRGAERELKRCLQSWNNAKITDTMSQQNIEWRFSPPASPHFGGAWERLIRSVKRALLTVLGRQALTDEMLSTFLTEVEGLLNSRPLTPVSDDPEDLEALTPNHFLIGRASPNLPPGVFSDSSVTSRKRWRHAQRLVHHFWTRWRREYLPTLTVRHKWMTDGRNIQTGDLVLVAEDNVPRGLWTMGRVIRTIPGADGRVRAAEIRTASGRKTRPAVRLCVLDQ